jgi:hypothetical protein
MPVILLTQEVGLGRSQIEASPGKKLARPPSQSINKWAWWHIPVILDIREA